MAECTSYMFKDVDSLYIWQPLSALQARYTAIQISGYPEEGHTRYAFWVSSDGAHTLLYFSTGLAEVVQNKKFKIMRVMGAKETKIEDGRIKYLMDEGSEWQDLGPVDRAGRTKADDGFDSIRKAHLKSRGAGAFDEEERKMVKKAIKNDFWSKGSGF